MLSFATQSHCYLLDLETSDFIKLFARLPTLRKVDLRHAGQFKDEVIDHIVRLKIPITDLRLDAANLVSKEKWFEFFAQAGHRLESLKLASLENAFDDETCKAMVEHCSRVQRLKLRSCSRLWDDGLAAISGLENLKHLSLHLTTTPAGTTLPMVISNIGPNLRTLSIEGSAQIDDDLLTAVRMSCSKLTKLRLSGSDSITDACVRMLFDSPTRPPLQFADFSNCRDVDYNAPDGPDEPVGLASSGFEALMEHSGMALEVLNIKSCRHISQESLTKVFNGKTRYPSLKEIDVSFVQAVDTFHIAAILKSCPNLKKVSAFACFNVKNISVPGGVALIGVPDAQTSIIHEG